MPQAGPDKKRATHRFVMSSSWDRRLGEVPPQNPQTPLVSLRAVSLGRLCRGLVFIFPESAVSTIKIAGRTSTTNDDFAPSIARDEPST